MGKAMVIFFSHAGENYFKGEIRSVRRGNTAIVAEAIAGAAGAEAFELKEAEPYPHDYRACVERARRELAEGARPALLSLPDASGCDTVFLGYPNWCGTIPMPVATALGALNLAGVRLAPFCTNEGSGMGRSERDIRRLAPGAALLPGLPVDGSRAEESCAEAAEWAQSCLR